MQTDTEPDAAPGRRAQECWRTLFAGMAYVRPVGQDGEVDYGIFAADGTPLAVAPTRALAIAIIRKYAMRPMDAH